MFPNETSFHFRSGDIAFLTKHEKELFVASILAPFSWVKVLRVHGFDTDALGTYTTDSYADFLPWNMEMLVFIDGLHDLEITDLAEGPEIILQRSGGSTEEIVKQAGEFGFP